VTPYTGLRPSDGAAWHTPPHPHLGPESETAMNDREVKHTVYGRPDRARTSRVPLDAVASRGLLTWWDLMSDLDPDWLSWSHRVAEEGRPQGQVA